MTHTPPQPSAPPPVTPPAPKKHRWLLYGCGGFLAVLLLIVLTVVFTVWWIQRPIKPVVLSARERAAVEEKLRVANAAPNRNVPATQPPSTPVPSRGTEAVELPGAIVPPNLNQEPGRKYVPGSKELRLTEREVNGLLNANTDLGKSVRLEFATDAINAYVAVPIPEDFPIGGGRMFRARSRFRVSLGNGGVPYAILEDVTVFGISLPKAWLGGLKGENLLARAMGEGSGSAGIKWIKRLRVETGALVLELED